MPTNVPVPTVAPGNIYTPTMYNNYLAANLNKLLNTGHRVLTVAQFAALTSPEGTKGTVAPDEVYLEVDSTNGVIWHLAYESGETTYKWRYIGGPALVSEVVTAESLPADATTTYRALTTAGPSVALPRAGDYDIEDGARITSAAQSGTGNASVTRMSYDIGGTGAVDADAITYQGASTAPAPQLSRKRRKTGLATGSLVAKYSHDAIGTGNGGTFENRTMIVTPVRIRHDA